MLLVFWGTVLASEVLQNKCSSLPPWFIANFCNCPTQEFLLHKQEVSWLNFPFCCTRVCWCLGIQKVHKNIYFYRYFSLALNNTEKYKASLYTSHLCGMENGVSPQKASGQGLAVPAHPTSSPDQASWGPRATPTLTTRSLLGDWDGS